MSDLINRQAAIDALAKFVPYVIDDVSTESYTNGLTDAYNLICQLPSAQPDIIQCRNCKFASGDSRICMKFGHSPIGELDFCSWAERRTDE